MANVPEVCLLCLINELHISVGSYYVIVCTLDLLRCLVQFVAKTSAAGSWREREFDKGRITSSSGLFVSLHYNLF